MFLSLPFYRKVFSLLLHFFSSSFFFLAFSCSILVFVMSRACKKKTETIPVVFLLYENLIIFTNLEAL